MKNEKATLKLVSLAVKTPRQTKAQHIPRGSHEFAPQHPLFGYHPQARPSPTKVDRHNQTLLRQTTKYSRLFCSFGLHCFFFYLQWCWSNPNTYPMASMSLLRLILFLVFIRRLALCLPKLTATIRHFWDKPQNIPPPAVLRFRVAFLSSPAVMLIQSQHIPDDIHEFTLPHPPEVLLSQSITGVKEQTNQRIAY